MFQQINSNMRVHPVNQKLMYAYKWINLKFNTYVQKLFS